METVIVKKIEAYMWECPRCGYFNMVDKNAIVLCDECCAEFKAEEKTESEI